MTTACIASQFHNIPAFEAMVGAEAYARLLGCHNYADDQFLLAGVLYVRAEHIFETFPEDRERSCNLRCEVTDIIEGTPVDPGHTSGLEFLASVLSTSADNGDDIALHLLNRLMERAGKVVAHELRNTINGAEKAASAPFVVETSGR